MAPCMIILIFLNLFTISVASSCSSGDKEIEVLKCKLNNLSRDFKELKDEMRKLKLKQNIDLKQIRLENEVEIMNLHTEHEDSISKLTSNHNKQVSQLEERLKDLKNITMHQDKSITTIKQERATWSTFCQLLSSDVCGLCSCVDDDTLHEKYYCDCIHLEVRRDCLEHYQYGNHINGLYKIHMNNMKTIRVYCDQQSDGGGWTVIQRRFDGTINFYRSWEIYRKGFGSLHREFWLGNEDIYLMTLQAAYPTGTELRIDMTDWNETDLYAKYETFLIDNEMLNYTIHVGGFSGNCGDSLTYHDGMQFSTYDRDNDADYRACSKVFRAAWWYKSCHYSNLNGEYRWKDEDQPGFSRCIVWYTFKGYEYSLKSVEIKLRRKVAKDDKDKKGKDVNDGM